MRPEDVAASAAGLLAMALGAATIMAVLQPEASMAENLPQLSIGGLLAGVVGLYLGSTRGYGRRVAAVGLAVALIGLLLFGGDVAFTALLDS